MTLTKIKTVLALTAITAVALPAGAQAKHGADDPAGHVRHARHHHRHHHHHAVRHHARHGADDGARHARHGADDGPNHR
jgi:Ni/Co efflux regulator RcnB